MSVIPVLRTPRQLHTESLFQKIFKAAVTIWPELDFERSHSMIKQIIGEKDIL